MIVNEKDLKDDVEKFLRSYAESYVQKAKHDITEFAKSAILEFYEEYTPTYYDRTFDLRDKSYSPYYRNTGKALYGGVTINTRNMQDYKGATAYEVADMSWIHGFHGDPNGYNGRFSPIRTAPPIDKVKNKMRNKAFLNELSDFGYQHAKSQKYKIIDVIL